MGFIFQQFNLLPRTTALRQVQLPLIYNGAENREERAIEALKEVGLADRLDHKPTELSGGQQQRVAVARALVNNPALIMADEPTGALDTRSGQELLGIFQRLNAQGKTILMVTHEWDVAMHCKRIVRFKDGRIISDELVEKPLNALEELAKLPKFEDEEEEEEALA
jgi:putative ABC transport system ATP-binding protein